MDWIMVVGDLVLSNFFGFSPINRSKSKLKSALLMTWVSKKKSSVTSLESFAFKGGGGAYEKNRSHVIIISFCPTLGALFCANYWVDF